MEILRKEGMILGGIFFTTWQQTVTIIHRFLPFISLPWIISLQSSAQENPNQTRFCSQPNSGITCTFVPSLNQNTAGSDRFVATAHKQAQEFIEDIARFSALINFEQQVIAAHGTNNSPWLEIIWAQEHHGSALPPRHVRWSSGCDTPLRATFVLSANHEQRLRELAPIAELLQDYFTRSRRRHLLITGITELTTSSPNHFHYRLWDLARHRWQTQTFYRIVRTPGPRPWQEADRSSGIATFLETPRTNSPLRALGPFLHRCQSNTTGPTTTPVLHSNPPTSSLSELPPETTSGTPLENRVVGTITTPPRSLQEWRVMNQRCRELAMETPGDTSSTTGAEDYPLRVQRENIETLRTALHAANHLHYEANESSSTGVERSYWRYIRQLEASGESGCTGECAQAKETLIQSLMDPARGCIPNVTRRLTHSVPTLCGDTPDALVTDSIPDAQSFGAPACQDNQ